MTSAYSSSLGWRLVAAIALFAYFFPSLRPVFKYLGAYAGVLFVVYIALVVLFLYVRRRVPRDGRIAQIFDHLLLSAAVLLAMFVVVTIVYPLADGLRTVGRGSDHDDCVILGVQQLVQGGFPYDVRTYIGNACSTGPGVFILAAPFVVMGVYPYLNVAALLLCFLVLRTRYGAAFSQTWLLLLVGMAVFMELTSVGSDLVFLSLLTLTVCVGLDTPRLQGKVVPVVLAAIVCGLIGAARMNFIVIPFVIGALVFSTDRRMFVTFTGVGLVIAVALWLGFFAWNPAHFSPYQVVQRSQGLAPFWVLAAGGLVSIGLFFVSVYLVRRSQFGVPVFYLVSMLPMFLVVAVGELGVREWDLSLWEGANFIAPLYPFAAYALVELALGPVRNLTGLRASH
ncbi:MAG: hypothetical protein O3B37_14365 [Proteobacteria bacterium]|nr:hypothetical protein [Pseudomonadota bacterium]